MADSPFSLVLLFCSSADVSVVCLLQLIRCEVEKEQLESDIRAEVQAEMSTLLEEAAANEKAAVSKAKEEAAAARQEALQAREEAAAMEQKVQAKHYIEFGLLLQCACTRLKVTAVLSHARGSHWVLGVCAVLY